MFTKADLNKPLTKKILIIDDEADFCLLLRSYFTRRKYEVYFSYSLTQGLQLLDTIKPDVVFLDNNLPDGSGWDMAEEIKSKFPGIELNLISAYRHEPPHCNLSGVYLWEKPVQLNELSKRFA
jgi:two-component system OmpR family response regulator